MQTYTEATKSQREREAQQRKYESLLHERTHLEQKIGEYEADIQTRLAKLKPLLAIEEQVALLDPSLTGAYSTITYAIPSGLETRRVILNLITAARNHEQARIEKLGHPLAQLQRQLKDVLKSLEQFED